jgi:hypothetical protein
VKKLSCLPKNLILIVLLCSNVSAFSNSTPFPGYYISSEGDSVLCDFKFNDWRNTPNTITVTVGNKTQTFASSEIKGFGVYGYGDYISANVSYHPGDISGTDLPDMYR